MQSVKLTITCRSALQKKYSAAANKKIDDAIAKWMAADVKRGLKPIYVAIDDELQMKKLKVPAVKGRVTPEKVKVALDKLVAALSPDYIAILGSHDVVPMFDVPNPTGGTDDTDPNVPTDNPYACSAAYRRADRSSYLIPDRVLGRIPDLPGSNDPSWLLSYLASATGWAAVPAAQYDNDFLVCTEVWEKAGDACVTYLSRKTETLLLSPPAKDGDANTTPRYAGRLQMIKCHGAANDSHFYGQQGNDFPPVLSSTSVNNRITPSTVVGAMCCFGANLYDPTAPTVRGGAPPIASTYLKQGAFAFLGSTCTAWVGQSDMICADWVVSAFLKSVLGSASTGRATLEAKQDFVRWSQQQGQQLDPAEEKTLLQYVLLGDPSVQPVEQTVARPGAATASLAVAAVATPSPAAAAFARRQRRSLRFEMAGALRSSLPARAAVKDRVPEHVRRAAGELAKESEAASNNGHAFQFNLNRPHVDRMTARIRQPELSGAAAKRVTAGLRASTAEVVASKHYQYYWTAKRSTSIGPQLRMVSVHADDQGNILRTQLLSSS